MCLSLQLKALMYEHYVILTMLVPLSLYSHASSIPMFNGLISLIGEQIQFHLGILDLDLSIQSEKHVITDVSCDEKKTFHDAWKKSNKLKLMFM